jgi:hypothetical protein
VSRRLAGVVVLRAVRLVPRDAIGVVVVVVVVAGIARDEVARHRIRRAFAAVKMNLNRIELLNYCLSLSLSHARSRCRVRRCASRTRRTVGESAG